MSFLQVKLRWPGLFVCHNQREGLILLTFVATLFTRVPKHPNILLENGCKEHLFWQSYHSTLSSHNNISLLCTHHLFAIYQNYMYLHWFDIENVSGVYIFVALVPVSHFSTL